MNTTDPKPSMTRTYWAITTLLLMAAGGCIFGNIRSMPTENNQPATPIDLKDLQLGMYCEVDMRMPPTAHPEAYRCYLGTVSAIEADAIVLADATEKSWVDYAPWSGTKPISAPRGTVRIPLTGVELIAVPHSPAQPAAHKIAPAASIPTVSSTQGPSYTGPASRGSAPPEPAAQAGQAAVK
jgi:hypothetical protein